MKRIQLVSLCIVAAFALSALVTASASAAPQYGKCLALTKNTTPKAKKGKYSDADCQKLFEKKGKPTPKGNFEFVPGPAANCVKMKKGEYTDAACTAKSAKAHKGSFEREACFPNCQGIGAEGGPAHLEAASGLKIECLTNGSIGGAILSATTAKGVAHYTGCHAEALGAAKCESGATEGLIDTNELLAEPEVKGGKVWINYTAKNPGAAKTGKEYLAEFKCGAIRIRVEDSAAGQDSGNENKQGIKSTQTFAKVVEGIEGQKLTTEANVGKGFEKPESSWQFQTTEFTANSPGEIKTTP
jgi:hypothetical protein